MDSEDAQRSKQNQEVDDAKKESPDVGFNLKDLAKAPVKPPEHVTSETEEDTNNSSVKFLMGVGLVLAIAGLLMIVANIMLAGFFVMLLGGLAITASVFTPLKK